MRTTGPAISSFNMENGNQQSVYTDFSPAQTYQPTEGQPNVVIVNQPVNKGNYGSQSKRVQCPSCHGFVMTNLMTKPTKGTHLIAGLLCVCCLWPCAGLPYCINCCKNVHHYCPNCGCYMGSYNFLN
ncbi:lipopolysaccharide-induced tumor necrosis factor-alpha factor homolog [Drosophila willistoni]|uniref:GK19389 n=1 Tax=Drosophila willistoni TaxID=7260 RepID=B4MQD0_DROWI|nr:lipopolysaccharide-induced tumor necrosis factor-alpha factor homolog [Drosophila willistoni]